MTIHRSVSLLPGLVAALGVGLLLVPHAARLEAHGARIAARVDVGYDATIQPLLRRRCVVCHSCYDSPCQLNLQSFEGLDRGATSERPLRGRSCGGTFRRTAPVVFPRNPLGAADATGVRS